MEKSPFKPILPRVRMQETFNIHEKIKQYGKEMDRYQMIQEAREDTEIYPTLEKYGCIDKLIMDKKGIYADFQELKDLRSMKDQQIKAMEMWNSLPYDVRMKFNNDVHEFAENGEKFVSELIEEENKQNQQPIEEQQTEQPKGE